MKKKVLFIVLPLIIVFAIGGFLYWKFVTSPEYSLTKINESIENHDITTFEKYVDVDGIIMRLMSQIPEIIGGNSKKAAMFGEEINQLILSVLQGPILKIAKESVRTVIERGHFDKSITQKDLMAELLKQVPIDSIKIIGLKEIRKQGKVCTVPIQIYVGAYEGETTLELMMRNKGSYWQVAEISNLPKVIYDIAELQKTFPYRNRYAAVIYMAYSIKDAGFKVSALAGIAAELAKAGNNENAAVVFSEAMEVAGSIKDADAKSQKLRGIAAELVKVGESEKAIEIAGSIKGAGAKFRALRGIAAELVKVGESEKAIEIAGSIKDARKKAVVLATIAIELAKAGEVEKAIEITVSIKDAYFKSVALGRIAVGLAKAGKVEKAIEFVDSIKDVGVKARVLVRIAAELAKAGKTKKAGVIFSEAIELAGSIKDAGTKSFVSKPWMLRSIATELAKAGKSEKAIEIAGSIKDASVKSRALREIATELAKVGKIEKAAVVFSQAIEATGSIKEYKSLSLRDIAAELAKAGKIEKAIEIAGSIKDARVKTEALQNIATELAKAGEVEKAIEITVSIKDAYFKSVALGRIAAGLAKAGKTKKAGVVFSEAIELAGSIKDAGYYKASALEDIAIELAKLKTKDKHEDAEIANSIMTALNR